MASNMSGPGLLFVMARISQPDIMDEPTYMNWYDNDHIAEIINTSGINSAFRFIRVDREKASFPYLALYPMDDIAFTQGEEFRKISVHSKLLPGSGLVYDLADNEVRYYGLQEVVDSTNKGKGHTRSIVPAQFELQEGFSVAEFETWVKDKHLVDIAAAKGYLRTTKFKLLYARTNAQSRALKGLPTTEEPGPEPPTWLVFHEFENDDLDASVMDSARSDAMNGDRFTLSDLPAYRIAKTHGQGDWFHGKSGPMS